MKKNKTIFISASSSGIGYHLASGYKDLGYNIIINGKKLSKLKKASAELGECDYFLGDISEDKNIKSLIKKIKKNYKNLDVLLCNLGSSNYKKNNLNLEYAFKYNFFSTTKLIKNSEKILKKNNSKIICISSICGVESIEGAPLGYSIAKSALNFYINLASREFAKDGITINGIVPGNILFDGSIWSKKMKNNSKKTKKYIKNNVPINKFGTPQNILSICKMITEDDNKFITGTLIKVDGGQTRSF